MTGDEHDALRQASMSEVATVQAEVRELLAQHEELKHDLGALRARQAAALLHLDEVEARLRREEKLEKQLRVLKQKLKLEPPEDGAALAEAAPGESLLASEAGSADDGPPTEELTGFVPVDTTLQDELELLKVERDELERALTQSEQKRRDLQEAIDSLLAEAAAVERQLEQERQFRGAAEQLAEESQAEAARERVVAADMRRQVDALRAEVQRLHAQVEEQRAELDRLREAASADRTALPVVSASDPPAPTTEPPAERSTDAIDMARVLGEFTATLREAVRTPLEVLTALEDVRARLDRLEAVQRTAAGAGASTTPEAGPRMINGRTAPAKPIRSEAPPAVIPAPPPLDEQPVTGLPTGTATSPYAPDVPLDTAPAPEAANPPPDGDGAAAAEEDWMAEFPRIELAWLHGRAVGDSHERVHFQDLVQRLRRADARARDDEQLLAALDEVQRRTHDAFSYCRLAEVARQLHRPTLNPVLLAVKLHQLTDVRHRHRHR